MEQPGPRLSVLGDGSATPFWYREDPCHGALSSAFKKKKGGSRVFFLTLLCGQRLSLQAGSVPEQHISGARLLG